MGRKNRAVEKREQVLQTFMDCILEVGLEKASMGEVGTRLNLDRSTIYHYYATRQELIEDAAKRITLMYVERIRAVVAKLPSAGGADQLIEHLFGSDFHQPDLSQMIDELSVAGNRDPAINAIVAGIYRSMEDVVVSEIDAAYPDAPLKRRREVAYAICQLSEGSSVYASLGFDTVHRRAAKIAALALLDQLHSAKQPTVASVR
jgi:AcrR family transcriptional regulator